jgi:hypothetical protein
MFKSIDATVTCRLNDIRPIDFHPNDVEKISCVVIHIHCMHAAFQSFQNALAYFATAVSYECKMFIKLPPAIQKANKSIEKFWSKFT